MTAFAETYREGTELKPQGRPGTEETGRGQPGDMICGSFFTPQEIKKILKVAVKHRNCKAPRLSLKTAAGTYLVALKPHEKKTQTAFT